MTGLHPGSAYALFDWTERVSGVVVWVKTEPNVWYAGRAPFHRSFEDALTIALAAFPDCTVEKSDQAMLGKVTAWRGPRGATVSWLHDVKPVLLVHRAR